MDNFFESYLKWLKNSVTEIQLNNSIQITVPFLDRYNDWFQIYVESSDNNNIRITDDGYVIGDLINCNTDLEMTDEKEFLLKVAHDYGIEISDTDELYIIATSETFPQCLTSLIQCMTVVNEIGILKSKKRKCNLTAFQIQQYLIKNDWEQDTEFKNKNLMVFINKTSGLKIAIPVDEKLVDFNTTVSSVLGTIAHSMKKKEDEVLNEICRCKQQ